MVGEGGGCGKKEKNADETRRRKIVVDGIYIYNKSEL